MMVNGVHVNSGANLGLCFQTSPPAPPRHGKGRTFPPSLRGKGVRGLGLTLKLTYTRLMQGYTQNLIYGIVKARPFFTHDPFLAFLATIKMSKQLDTLSDEALAKLAQAGERAAFELLCDRHLSTVYNRLRALLPPDAVEDVTQETFIAAMQAIQGYRGQSLFRTWLSALARHKVADYYRKQSRQPETISLDGELEGENETLADPNARHEERALVRDALWRLPAHYQEVLLLRFAEGLPFEQMASTLGLSLEATKSRFRRAIAAAAQEMQTGD